MAHPLEFVYQIFIIEWEIRHRFIKILIPWGHTPPPHPSRENVDRCNTQENYKAYPFAKSI